MVVRRLLCPSNFWIVRRSVPCSSKRLANQCLNWWVCNDHNQAFFAHVWIIVLSQLCERWLRKDFHLRFTNTYSQSSSHLIDRYWSRAILTAGTMNTVLWCHHFPVTMILSQSISESFRCLSSADLSPQPYSTNKIARFLMVRNVMSHSIAWTSCLKSSNWSVSWGFDLIFGSVIAS